MAAISYPSNLPLPLLKGYRYKSDPKFVRTSLPGAIQQRRKFTSGQIVYRISFLFTDINLYRFQNFYINTIKNGLEWFNLKLNSGDGIMISKEVRIISGYEVNRNGLHYNLSFEVEE